MFCKKCGREQRPGEKFCAMCGKAYNDIDERPSEIKESLTKGMTIVSKISGDIAEKTVQIAGNVKNKAIEGYNETSAKATELSSELAEKVQETINKSQNPNVIVENNHTQPISNENVNDNFQSKENVTQSFDEAPNKSTYKKYVKYFAIAVIIFGVMRACDSCGDDDHKNYGNEYSSGSSYGTKDSYSTSFTTPTSVLDYLSHHSFKYQGYTLTVQGGYLYCNGTCLTGALQISNITSSSASVVGYGPTGTFPFTVNCQAGYIYMGGDRYDVQ